MKEHAQSSYIVPLKDTSFTEKEKLIIRSLGYETTIDELAKNCGWSAERIMLYLVHIKDKLLDAYKRYPNSIPNIEKHLDYLKECTKTYTNSSLFEIYLLLYFTGHNTPYNIQHFLMTFVQYIYQLENIRLPTKVMTVTPKKYLVSINGRPISFTSREYAVLAAFAHGNSIKSISSLLNISSRTVEVYMNNIKHKTGLNYKSEIIQKLSESALESNNLENLHEVYYELLLKAGS